MLQHTHESTPFSAKKNHLIVICDGVQSPANIGAIFRLCDAFGVSEIISSIPFDIASNRLKRTSRSTESTVPYQITEDLKSTITSLKKDGYQIISLEITAQSIPLSELPHEAQQKAALIIGNEKHGISESILSLSDYTVHIPMFGQNSSMNVAQATAIALYELTKH